MDPMQNQGQPSPAPEKKAFGPLIGIVIVIMALVLGGLYFWGQRVAQDSAPIDEAQDAGAQGEADQIPPVSEGDDIESIEQDLSADPSLDFDFSDLEEEASE